MSKSKKIYTEEELEAKRKRKIKREKKKQELETIRLADIQAGKKVSLELSKEETKFVKNAWKNLSETNKEILTKKSIDKNEFTIRVYAAKLWSKYKKPLSTSGREIEGKPEIITPGNFLKSLRAYANEELSESDTNIISALSSATSRYQRSAEYRTKEERYQNLSLGDYLQDASRADIRRWMSLTRENGKFKKFDPTKIKHIANRKDGNGRYTVDRYGNNIIILTFNSPNERVFFSRNSIPEEYADLVWESDWSK